MSLERGHVIDGRFRVERELGAGGMGVVYLARQVNVDRRVAIKLLRPERADDERAIDQFLTETAAVSRLTSPHTVTLYDAGRTAAGDPYIAMEYLPGPTLRQRMKDPIEPEEVVRILDGISLSLAEAHERGIVHRDLKPANVLLARTPGHQAQVKVLDFGLARLIDTDDADAKAAGTLRYMAPEALRGDRVDARADVYALAMVAYEMFSGRYPFDDSSRERLIAEVLTQVPPALDEGVEPPLPARATKLIARGLAKHPRLRPRDAATFRRLLRRAFGLPDEPLDEPTEHDGSVGSETLPSQTVVSKTLPGTVAGETTLFIPMKSSRRIGWILAALTAMAVVVALSLREPSPSPIAPSPGPSAATDVPIVTLDVRSVPSGATVRLDGDERGVTPLALTVPRGVGCDIAIAADGYETHRQRFHPKRAVDLVIRLTPRATSSAPDVPPRSESPRAPRAPSPGPQPKVAKAVASTPEPAPVTVPAASSAPPPAPPPPRGSDFDQRVNDYMD